MDVAVSEFMQQIKESEKEGEIKSSPIIQADVPAVTKPDSSSPASIPSSVKEIRLPSPLPKRISLPIKKVNQLPSSTSTPAKVVKSSLSSLFGSGKVALITGASSGLGLEFAKLLAQKGYHLVLVARNEQKLKDLKSDLEVAYPIKAHIIVKDLAQPRSPQEIYDELSSQHIIPELLINNAGFGSFGEFYTLNWVVESAMIQVNVVALCQLTHLFLPDLIKQKRGKILNVASLAGFQPGPLMATYYATKSYVLSFSQSLSNELRGTGVSVTVLCPGPTATEFARNANLENVSKLFKRKPMSAEVVVKTGYTALMNGKTIAIPGFSNRLLIFLERFIPRKMQTQIVRNMQEKVSS